MDKKRKQFITVYSILIILTVFFIIYLIGQNCTRQIKEDMIIGNGFVFNSKMAHKGGVNIFYSFSFNNTIVGGTKYLAIPSDLRAIFVNKSFPVVFSSSKTDLNQMLILPKDFERFDLPFPDSLEWINERIK